MQTPLEILRSLPALAGLLLVPDAVRALMAAGDTLDAAHAALEAWTRPGQSSSAPTRATAKGRSSARRGPPGASSTRSGSSARGAGPRGHNVQRWHTLFASCGQCFT